MLEIQDLHVKFHNQDREAVSGVSLTIQDGEILGLVGESGSGKSVTAMSVAGLLPRKQCDYTGRILLDGQELLHADRSVLREIQGAEIGVVFQEPQSCMDPLMKIGSQVEETLRIHTQMPKEERYQRALAALAAAELPDPEGICSKYPHELSGGMRQRVMIAMALAQNPSLIIADEPTTALDVTIQAQIMELMKEMKEKTGVSIMLITHDMGVVAEMADKIMVMYAGMVIEYATAREIFKDPKHPYTKGLLASIPRKDKDIDRLYTIEGTVPSLTSMPKGCRFCDRCTCAMEKCRNEQPPMYQFGERSVRCFLYEDKGGVSDER